jgi:Eco57I restriction-modification methylase
MGEVDSGKRYNRVLEIIEKRLIPDEEAKKARGEVFTPLNLVREMLFGLRKSAIEKGATEIWGLNKDGEFIDDDESDRIGGAPLEIFRDSESKWLDPANGIGNFPVVAFYMLDYQLNKHGKNKDFRGEENAKKRQEHIVKNMLYMIELNKGNVNACIKIFKLISPDVKPNVCCANTLEMTDEKLKLAFGINRFDVVMGNPPYNEGGTGTSGEKRIWTKFIQFGFDLLNKNGCLIFVHPPNFHRINKDDIKKGIIVKSIFDKNNLLFIRIIDDTRLYFDVQIGIDYYILQKKDNNKEATVLDKHNILTDKIDISIFNSVPNFGFNIIKKLELLRRKKGEFNAKVGTDSTSHAARHDLYKNGTFPIIHLINNDGMRILKAINPHKYQKTPKVLINGLGVPYVLDDSDGKYGVSEAPLYILEPSNKEKIFLFSKLFQYLTWAYRIQGNHNSLLLFDIMPDMNKFNFNNEKKMVTELGLEEDEKEINKYNVPTFKLIEKIEKAGEGKAKKTRAIKPKRGGRRTRKIRHT